MTDTTPAIERAARARWNAGVRQQWQRVENDDEWPSWVTPEARDRQRDLARASLAAALVIDELAQVANVTDGRLQGRVAPSWEGLSEAGKAYYRAHAEALRAAILGEAP